MMNSFFQLTHFFYYEHDFRPFFQKSINQKLPNEKVHGKINLDQFSTWILFSSLFEMLDTFKLIFNRFIIDILSF